MTQSAALARLLPKTDVFHFYFGLTLVPKSLQFPLLRATRRKSVFHYLGSDIRGKTPRRSSPTAAAPAREIVGSYDALRWVPGAHVVPPGLDLSLYTPVPPSDTPRPLVVHAPSNRERKGTAHVIEACAQLPVDLEIVEGLHHDEARARYARADIVVDQLNAGWHGVFALEAMALGKPVVAHLKPDVVERAPRASASACRSCPRRRRRSSTRCGRSSRTPRSAASSAPRAAPTSSRCTTSTGSPTA